jgi:hypothetical protein
MAFETLIGKDWPDMKVVAYPVGQNVARTLSIETGRDSKND